MFAFLSVCLLFSFITGSKAGCVSICGNHCNAMTANFENNQAVQCFNISSGPFMNSCQANCDQVYCTCMAILEDACQDGMQTCKSKVSDTSICKTANSVCQKAKEQRCYSEFSSSMATTLLGTGICGK